MTKKLCEVAEINSLSAKIKLHENDILLSRAGKKIVRIIKDNIEEYQGKTIYLVISTSSEYVDSIYDSLKSKKYEVWFKNNAEGTAQPTINVLALKDYDINI